MHRLPEQLSSVSSSNPQLLTSGVHRLPLALEIEFLRISSFRLVEVPGAVDGPVSEVAVSGEAERARGFGVVEEVAD